MANEEHLAKLREGPEAWNQWREEDADVVPDLIEANLLGANLDGADFHEIKLVETVFGATDLREVKDWILAGI